MVISNKAKGSFLELEFAAECIKRGATVSQPFGDDAKYDFLVDANKKIHKVQVKTAVSRGGKSYNVRLSGNNDLPYTSEQIDCVATKIEGSWYFIDRLGTQKTTITLNGQAGGALRSSKYRDRWDLIGLSGESDEHGAAREDNLRMVVNNV